MVRAAIPASRIRFDRLRIRTSLDSFDIHIFSTSGRVGFAGRPEPLNDRRRSGAHLSPAEVENDLGGPTFLRHAYLEDTGDEAGLREHFVADPEVGKLVSLLLLCCCTGLRKASQKRMAIAAG
jgi:hypothetical protein